MINIVKWTLIIKFLIFLWLIYFNIHILINSFIILLYQACKHKIWLLLKQINNQIIKQLLNKIMKYF